mgnify:CR=1 FL=1
MVQSVKLENTVTARCTNFEFGGECENREFENSELGSQSVAHSLTHSSFSAFGAKVQK